MIHYQTDVSLTEEELIFLYHSVGWSNYTCDVEKLMAGIAHSLKVISAWESDKLIGLIRCVGDGYTICYVQDLIVHPDFQNQKIGSTLMSTLLAEFPKVRQKVLLTDENVKTRQFYERLGFSSCDTGELVAFYREF